MTKTQTRKRCPGVGDTPWVDQNHYPHCKVCDMEFSTQSRKTRQRWGVNPYEQVPRHYIIL